MREALRFPLTKQRGSTAKASKSFLPRTVHNCESFTISTSIGSLGCQMAAVLSCAALAPKIMRINSGFWKWRTEARKITSDPNTYRQVAISANGRILATSYKQFSSSIWIAATDRFSGANQITTTAEHMDGFTGLAWLPGDRLLFTGSEQPRQIWQMDMDGKNRQQLTHFKDFLIDPSVTVDGSNILFAAENGVWRMGGDGSEARQIVDTKQPGSDVVISPDGTWFAYETATGLLRRQISGGEATLIDPKGFFPAVSHDGRKLAFQHLHLEDKNVQIGVVTIDSTAPPVFLPFLPITEEQVPTMANQPIHWSPLDDAVTYGRTVDGASNVWSQPISGGPPRQITHFTTGYICRHAWSIDGKYLALARGTISKDAVLLTDLR